MTGSCRRLLTVCILGLGGLITGGTALAACEAELGQLASGLPADMPDGSRAAQLLYGAVELVEPVLPAWSFNGQVPLAPEEAGHQAVSWLVGRDLLPDDWRPDELDPATWRAMLAGFLDWYELELPDGDYSGQDPVADLGLVLDQVGPAVRPVAIVAHEENREVAFLGILWNWTRYPRLLVRRVEAGTSVSSGTGELLQELSNCAVTLDRYALAPVATAWRLFVGTGDSTMFVLESDPERPQWPLAVTQQDVQTYLEFTAREVAGTGQFAAAFSGQEIGFGAIVGMVTQIRTNVSPFRIGYYLAVPTP